jgi:hypothetical protein
VLVAINGVVIRMVEVDGVVDVLRDKSIKDMIFGVAERVAEMLIIDVEIVAI